MWKKYTKITFMFGLFFLVFGLGVSLPDRLFAIADEKREAAATPSSAAPLILPDAEQVAAEKKLRFLYQTGNLSSLRFFDLDFNTEEVDKIKKKIKKETKNLQKHKLIPKKAALKEFLMEKFSILDTSESGDFLTMWFVTESILPNGSLQFFIDAESGKILSIDYTNEKERNWKSAPKNFRTYLCQELSIDAKDIPKFIFYCDNYGYAITSECFLTYRDLRGYSDVIRTTQSHATSITDAQSG